jgi:hypothetical protein
MGFLSPWFLGGLVALGLPVYLHLLKQHRSNPLPFSSIMFFERRTQSSIKHRRLKYLLLMCLRLALLLLLALVFASPFISRRADAIAQGRKLVVLAVDNSFSMRANDRLAAAKQEASNTVSSVRPGDQGQVIAFGTQTQVMNQPSADPSELRAAVQGVTQGDSRSAYGELARTIRSIARQSQQAVEVHIFSDMQKTSMPAPFSELNVPSNVRIVLHNVGTAKPEANWYVDSVNAPRAIYREKKTAIQATIGGEGTPAGDVEASLVLNNRVLDTKKATLAANGRAMVEFPLPDTPYGFNRGEIRLASRDHLPADDRFPFVIQRREPSRILFIHEARDNRSVLYVSSALESSIDAAFTLDAVTTEQAANVSPDKYAFVVLSDVASISPQMEDSLRNYIRRGGSMLVTLGPAAATRSRTPVFDTPVLESRYAGRNEERFQIVASTDSTHPSVQKLNDFEGVRFFQTVRVAPGQDRVVARLTDQTPLLLERKIGEGRAMLFCSTLDNVSNDLPLHASFVPFVEQTARYLSGFDQAPAQYLVDSFAELRTAKDQGASIEVLDPDGKRALSLKESTTAPNVQLTREGFYEIRRANGRNEVIAVHADRRESNLTPVPKDTLDLWQNLGMGSGNTPGAGGSTSPPGTKPFLLWWYFGLALLVIAVIESIFGSRYLSVEGKPLVKKEAA